MSIWQLLLVNLKKTASALNKQNDNLKLSSDSSDIDSDEPEPSPIKKKASKKKPKTREPKKKNEVQNLKINFNRDNIFDMDKKIWKLSNKHDTNKIYLIVIKYFL